MLSDPTTNDKRGMRNNDYLPTVSIVDPLLMKTMPKPVLAAVGFDALCHNMEAFLSRKRQPFSEIMALRGMELSVKFLPRVYENPDDDEAWEAVTLASTFGGMSIYTSSVVAPHGIEHPASGLRDIVHGCGLAALTPIVYEHTLSAAPRKVPNYCQTAGRKKSRRLPGRYTPFS